MLEDGFAMPAACVRIAMYRGVCWHLNIKAARSTEQALISFLAEVVLGEGQDLLVQHGCDYW